MSLTFDSDGTGRSATTRPTTRTFDGVPRVKMKLRDSFIPQVLAIVLTWAAGAVGGPPATTQSTQQPDLNGLYVTAFGDLPTFVNEKETRFIAIGFDDDRNPIDPTPQLLERFADAKPPVKPASQAKGTGKKTRIYYVIIRERYEDDSIRLAVGFRSGPLGGGGSAVIYKHINGKWKLEQVLSYYVS